MTIQEAIKRAISSGFVLKEIHLEETSWGAEMAYPHILLDPLFWQALGKSMGWKEKGKHHIDNSLRPALRCSLCDGKPMVGSGYCSYSYTDEWKENWHRLTDHLAEGKSIESYFEDYE